VVFTEAKNYVSNLLVATYMIAGISGSEFEIMV